MHWSHVGKVVSAVLLAAAAVVGIVAGLTSLVGLPVAVVGIVLLIVGATVVAVVTQRPKTGQPPAKAPAPKRAEPNTDRFIENFFGVQSKAAKVVPPFESPKTSDSVSSRPRRKEVSAAKEEQIVQKNVEVKDVASIRLKVSTGDRLYGHLREKEDLDFGWFIVDLANLGLMERGEDYDYEVGEEDVPNAAVGWTAPI